jgi:hypothetical protein
VQPGHHVDIWRLGGVKPSTAITLTELSAQQWATATLIVANAPVVDVRASSGSAVARSPQAVPGKSEGGSANGASSSSSSAALQILTVGVPPATARDILALVAEEDQAGFTLWVTLAPLTTTLPSEVNPGWTQP